MPVLFEEVCITVKEKKTGNTCDTPRREKISWECCYNALCMMWFVQFRKFDVANNFGLYTKNTLFTVICIGVIV